MAANKLRLYRALARAPFTKRYVGKVLPTAFLGTHVPLLALLVYLVRRRRFALAGVLCISCRSAGFAAGTCFKCAGWQGRNRTVARRVVV